MPTKSARRNKNLFFFSRGPPGRRSNYRVFVSGLPPTGSWQDLKDHMREAGDVCYADVRRNVFYSATAPLRRFISGRKAKLTLTNRKIKRVTDYLAE